MNFLLKPGALGAQLSQLQKLPMATAHTRNFGRYQKIFCGLLALTWPYAAAYAQSSSSSQQSSSSRSSPAQAQPPSQAQAATSSPPQQKEDSLAEAARKAKAKKPAAAK